LHLIHDVDEKPAARAETSAREWVDSFGGNFRSAKIQGVERSFTGTAVVRVRATVGHDSYERLVEVVIPPGEQWLPAGVAGASPISDPLKNPEAVGLASAILIEKAMQDEGVAEFCRFYLDRREQELQAAGTDARKRKKIQDDFTPQLEAFLVGLEGTVQRRLQVNGMFDFGSGPAYESVIAVIPAETLCPSMLFPEFGITTGATTSGRYSWYGTPYSEAARSFTVKTSLNPTAESKHASISPAPNKTIFSDLAFTRLSAASRGYPDIERNTPSVPDSFRSTFA
jgi:hypothetical protein